MYCKHTTKYIYDYDFIVQKAKPAPIHVLLLLVVLNIMESKFDKSSSFIEIKSLSIQLASFSQPYLATFGF